MKWTALVTSGMAVAALTIAYGCQKSSLPSQPGGDGTNPNNDVMTGPCAPEGASRNCHLVTGTTDNIINCVSGTQSCSNGLWGPCGGSVSGHSANLGPGLHTDVFGPSQDAGGCGSNVCDPYCWGIDDDAGFTAPTISTQCVFPDDPKDSYRDLDGAFQLNPSSCTAGPTSP